MAMINPIVTELSHPFRFGKKCDWKIPSTKQTENQTDKIDLTIQPASKGSISVHIVASSFEIKVIKQDCLTEENSEIKFTKSTYLHQKIFHPIKLKVGDTILLVNRYKPADKDTTIACFELAYILRNTVLFNIRSMTSCS